MQEKTERELECEVQEEPDPSFNPVDQLPDSPTVTVEFSGLLLVSPGPDHTCVVGVHRWAANPKHMLWIGLTVIRPNKPPTVYHLYSDNLEGPPFSIEVKNPTGAGVTAFMPSPTPFRRDNSRNHENDLRWALNINWLHPDATTVNDGVYPGVTLNEGVLYTPDKTDEAKVKITLTGPTNPCIPSIGANIGAAIPLDGNNKVVLKWMELGNEITRELPRQEDPANTTYVVSIFNEPLQGGETNHDELALYYKVLCKRQGGGTFNEQEKYHLGMTLLSPHFEKTDEIPCMPIIGRF